MTVGYGRVENASLHQQRFDRKQNLDYNWHLPLSQIEKGGELVRILLTYLGRVFSGECLALSFFPFFFVYLCKFFANLRRDLEAPRFIELGVSFQE